MNKKQLLKERSNKRAEIDTLQRSIQVIINKLNDLSPISDSDADQLEEDYYEFLKEYHNENDFNHDDLATADLDKLTDEEILQEIIDGGIPSATAERIHTDREANRILLGDNNE